MADRFGYVVVIEKEREADLQTFLRVHAAEVEELEDVYYDRIVIHFPLEKNLEDYLKENIRRDSSLSFFDRLFIRKSKLPDYFPDEQTGRVGFIYFHITQSVLEEHCFAVFTAATTRMSGLFTTSDSVRNWFIRLATHHKALSCFIDLEEYGYQSIIGNDGVDIVYKDSYRKLRSLILKLWLHRSFPDNP